MLAIQIANGDILCCINHLEDLSLSQTDCLEKLQVKALAFGFDIYGVEIMNGMCFILVKIKQARKLYGGRV